VIFARYLRHYNFIFLAVLFLPFSGQAQEAGYAPPPMFEDMTPPMVRPESATGNIVEPKVSAPPIVVDTPQKPVVVAPRMSVDPSVTQERKMIPIPQKKLDIAPLAISNSVPATAFHKQVERESAIKGPKSMPALPTTMVEAEVTYNGDEGVKKKAEPTMLERNQVLRTKEPDLAKTVEPIEPIVPRPKNMSAPASFVSADQGISFEAGQIRIPDELTNSIAAGVVKELDAKDKAEWRVQIKSFATPHGDGISSDKRIALSRALSLRSSLIEQGVAANRIDVLAEGIKVGEAEGLDRIDLYLYGTKAP
jgi:hypothetical protein